MAPARIAMHWKLHGPQLAISTACASSLDAIGTAANMIERGEVETAIAGGTEMPLSPLVYESLLRAGALSRNADSQRASRPFDADRDGFVMGDGGAMLVLESVEHATRRGTPILARIRGYGSVADAHHITSPDPSARYEIAAMQKALAQASEAARACAVVYAHATGTIVGDTVEMRAINAVNPNALVTSIKGHVGHSMGAAGAMCAVAAIAGMHAQCVPPTMGTQQPEAEARFEVVMERPRAFAYDAFQLNAFGFGGQNASLVMSR
jgi:3-oxoacyl-[acyl-carrier-protein] synthase II